MISEKPAVDQWLLKANQTSYKLSGENAVAQTIVRIISELPHQPAQDQFNNLVLLVEVASILSSSTLKFDPSTVFVQGLLSTFTKLFDVVSSTLKEQAVPLVAALQYHFKSSQVQDPLSRSVYTIAVTKLIRNNKATVEGASDLQSLWNIFFAWDSILDRSTPDRLVLIDSIGELIELVVQHDISLAKRIVLDLMCMGQRTSNELQVSQKVLLKLFSLILKQTDGTEMVLDLFLQLLNPYSEMHYELLDWAVSSFLDTLKIGKDIPKPVLKYSKTILEHLASQHDLVRFGASISLNAVMNCTKGEILVVLPEIISQLIDGIINLDFYSLYLNLSMLKTIHKYLKLPESETAELDALLSDHFTSIDPHSTWSVLNTVKVTQSKSFKQLLQSRKLNQFIEKILIQSDLKPPQFFKYLSTFSFVSKMEQLRRLDVVLLWTRKMDTCSSYLLNTMIPMLSHKDEEIREKSIEIVNELLQKLSKFSPKDILNAWNQIVELSQVPEQGEFLFLLKQFPFAKLDRAHGGIICQLAEFCVNKNALVRRYAYQTLDALHTSATGKTKSLVFSLILCCLCDYDYENYAFITGFLLKNIASTNIARISSFLEQLSKFKNAFDADALDIFDQMANAIATNDTLAKELIGLIATPLSAVVELEQKDFKKYLVDYFWSFWMNSTSEIFIPRPDDYDFSRIFCHGPFWVPLLCCKLQVRPPSEKERNSSPDKGPEKRRFECGFLICTLPTCGFPDTVLRRLACQTAIRAAMKEDQINRMFVHGLLELVSQQMMAHRQWSYQTSAIELLQYLLKLKTPLSRCVLVQYLDMAIDASFNTPDIFVKLSALDLIEQILLIFPKGINARLAEIRDVCRNLMIEKDKLLNGKAMQIYPLVFACVRPEACSDFFNYATLDISNLLEKSVDLTAQVVQPFEVDNVIVSSLLAIGSLNVPGLAPKIIQYLVKNFMVHQNPRFRLAALEAIAEQITFARDQYIKALKWLVLSAVADTNRNVKEFARSIIEKTVLTISAKRRNASTFPDDDFQLDQMDWDSLLLGSNGPITVNFASRKECFSASSVVLPKPIVAVSNADLLQEIKALKYAEVVSDQFKSDVCYLLQDIFHGEYTKRNGLVALCLFATMHSDFSQVIIPRFLSILSSEAEKDELLIAIKCLVVMVEANSDHFKLVFDSINQNSVDAISEHEISLLKKFATSFTSFSTSLLNDYCSKYLEIANTKKFTLEKRLEALSLAISFASATSSSSGVESMKILDSMQTIFIDYPDHQVHLMILENLHTPVLLQNKTHKHAFFRNIASLMKQNLYSSTEKRLEALQLFQLSSLFFDEDEQLYFAQILLADSEIREQAAALVAKYDLIPELFTDSEPKAGKFVQEQPLGAVHLVKSLNEFYKVQAPLNVEVAATIKQKTSHRLPWSLTSSDLLKECAKKHEQNWALNVEFLFTKIEEFAVFHPEKDYSIQELEHSVDLLSNLLQNGSWNDDYLKRLLNFIIKTSESASDLRETLFIDQTKCMIYACQGETDFILTEEALREAETLRMRYQEARLEISKYGNVSKLVLIEEEEKRLEQLLHKKHDFLAVSCEMTCRGLKCYSELAKSLDETNALACLDSLMQFHDNDHRLIRAAASQGIVDLIKSLSENSRPRVLVIGDVLLKKLTSPTQPLYRQKIEIIYILVNLFDLLTSQVKIDIIKLLCDYLSDPDPEMQRQAIKMMKQIRGTAEFRSLLVDSLMPLICLLLQSLRFKEKQLLQSLLA